MRQPDVSANDGASPNGDTSQHRGIGIDGDMVFDDRMAGQVHWQSLLIQREILCSQSDALVEAHMVADDRSLANNDTRPVIDTKIFADLCPRVNVDTGIGMGHLSDDAGDEGNLQLEELMCHSLMEEGDHGWIAKDDLTGTFGRRIAIQDRFHIGRKQMLHEG